MPLAFDPSPNVAELQESATIAVSARARALRAQGLAVVDLGAGEPDFPTPGFICEAAARAVDAGATRYTATPGIAPLRSAIAEQATELCGDGPPISPEQVVVSCGSKQALFNACFVLFGPGDEVLVPTPGWTSYFEMIRLARATPVSVPGDPANSLKVTPEALRELATPRTRGLLLNSPNNPTGAVYDASELRAILSLASERGWWVLGDEIYRGITYEEVAPSLLEVAEDRERLLLFDGVAKRYAMTGWRIGWSVSPPAVAAAMCALQSHTTSNAAAVSQHAALAALTQRDEGMRALEEMVGHFRRRRDAALELLADADAEVVHPAGAFYLYVRVGEISERDHLPGASFARSLLDLHQVAVVPGDAFGTPEWVRLSYAAPLEDVTSGVERMSNLLAEKWSSPGRRQ